MARLVLVHGACHGGWCWERMLGPLRGDGHVVDVVELPGRETDETDTADISLEDWTRAVFDVIDGGTKPVVLVAHSMGGVTASQVAEMRPEDIERLIYVAAVIPTDGQDAITTFYREGTGSLLLAPGVLIRSADERHIHVAPDRAASVFYSDTDEDSAKWAVAKLCLEPAAPLMTALTLSDERFGSVAKSYVVALRDKVIPPGFQRDMAARAGADTVEIDADHSPPIGAVPLLSGAIRSVLGG